MQSHAFEESFFQFPLNKDVCTLHRSQLHTKQSGFGYFTFKVNHFLCMGCCWAWSALLCCVWKRPLCIKKNIYRYIFLKPCTFPLCLIFPATAIKLKTPHQTEKGQKPAGLNFSTNQQAFSLRSKDYCDFGDWESTLPGFPQKCLQRRCFFYAKASSC